MPVGKPGQPSRYRAKFEGDRHRGSPAKIEEGRAVFANIRNFLIYILTSNVPELIPYLAFVVVRIPLPLTIIQILAVDLGTDMLPALGLAGIATEILLIALIDYTPWGNALFGTAPIPAAVWLFIIPFALGMVALEELRKWFVRARPNRPTTARTQENQFA